MDSEAATTINMFEDATGENSEQDAVGVDGGGRGFGRDYKYLQFVAEHSPQLELSGVPHHLWPVLFDKVSGEVFDAGDAFCMVQQQLGRGGQRSVSVQVCAEDGEQVGAADTIYLIDHAWSYPSLAVARDQLSRVPGLVERMCKLMSLQQPPAATSTTATTPPTEATPTTAATTTDSELVEQVLHRMWLYCQTYRVNTPGSSVEDQLPVWYVMDEFGSAIPHSADPTCRVVPFYCIPQRLAYSLLFPISTLNMGDEVSRNYIEYLERDGGKTGPQDEEARKLLATCCLLPWVQADITALCSPRYDPQWTTNVGYFKSGRDSESLPIENSAQSESPAKPLKVYAQYEFVNKYLTDSKFSIVDHLQDADILWLSTHFKEYEELSEEFPEKFINQFPFENVVTIKDLMAVVARRQVADAAATVDNGDGDEEGVNLALHWLPTTYNLTHELPQFVANYQTRQKLELDNHWIVKPWNLARGLDIHITDDIDYVIRLRESGPMIVSKYIENPVLFQREDIPDGPVKFDLRYIVLLKSVQPLKLYVYDKFWLRFSNKPFALDDFTDSEKHFTVMNYKEDADNVMKNMLCEDFIPLFESQYPLYPWSEIEGSEIHTSMRQLFRCATAAAPPCGIGPSGQSRAVYGVDVMLKWLSAGPGGRGRPRAQLLEVNFMPDCERACLFYPDFYNHVFTRLFLQDDDDLPITQLI